MKKIKLSTLATIAIFIAVITISVLTNKASMKMLVFKIDQRIEMLSN